MEDAKLNWHKVLGVTRRVRNLLDGFRTAIPDDSGRFRTIPDGIRLTSPASFRTL